MGPGAKNSFWGRFAKEIGQKILKIRFGPVWAHWAHSARPSRKTLPDGPKSVHDHQIEDLLPKGLQFDGREQILDHLG